MTALPGRVEIVPLSEFFKLAQCVSFLSIAIIFSFSEFFKLAQCVSFLSIAIIFSLPVSNGKHERIFSVLKLIKVNRRSSLALMLTHALTCGGKLKHEDLTRRKEKSTRSKQVKLLNLKLKVAVTMTTHFCWMTGIIGWLILKHDLCTVRHAAYIV